MGYALTEILTERGGSRPGFGVGPDLGWRFAVGDWTSVGVRASFQGQLYPDGTAVYPALVLEARAHGAQE